MWIAALVGAAGAAASPQSPPGMVDIGGRRLHVSCAGEGSPTVILTAGMGESGESWRAIMPDIAKTTRTCAWDRAGLGLSEWSAEPQDVEHTAGDLERLLKAARIDGPYVLVGHSIGSFESLMFAYRHTKSVAAMVLVDPSSPFQNQAFSAASPAFGAFTADRLKQRTASMRACATALRSGVASPVECSNSAPSGPVAARIAQVEAIASLTENWDRSSAQLLKARRRLGRIPLIVLTAGKRPALPGNLKHEEPKIALAWNRMHDELAAQSNRGINRQVPDAGHYIHVDRPDVVIAAIKEAIAESRRDARD